MSTPEVATSAGGGASGEKSLVSVSVSSSSSSAAVVSSVASVTGGGGGLVGKTVSSGGGGGASTTTTTIPIDLAAASKVLVRTDKATIPGGTTTYRFGSTATGQMRVVIPSSVSQQTYYRQPANIKQDATTNRTQISTLPAGSAITAGATARTAVTATSVPLTVSRAQSTTPTTVSYHVSNRTVQSATPIVTANLPPGAAVRATTINGPIRISTPPIQVANSNSGGGGGGTGTGGATVATAVGNTTYVRMPPNVVQSQVRSTTTGATATATATTTLVQNFQMSAQLIRAAAGGAGGGATTGTLTAAGVTPRARVVTQTTLPASHHQVVQGSAAGTPVAVVNSSAVGTSVVGGQLQTVVSSGSNTGGSNNAGTSGATAATSSAQHAYVAALSMGPRQVSTLVYTNNSATGQQQQQQPQQQQQQQPQQYTISSGPNQQRLTLATTLSPQRPTTATVMGAGTTGTIRPTIQRLPTTGIRVSNFRSPVLTPTTVLTTIASGIGGASATLTNTQQNQRTVTSGTTNISNAIPARIIQVPNPAASGGTTAGTAQIVNGRIQTNLLNIQPLIVSSSNGRQTVVGGSATQQQPAGLTIAQVTGKLTQVGTVGNVAAATASTDSASNSTTTTTLQTASGQQIVVSTTGGVPGVVPVAASGGTPATIITGNLITTGGSAAGASSGSGGGGGGAGVAVSAGAHHGTGQITQIVNMSAPTVVSVASGAQVGASTGGTATTVIPIPLALTGARSIQGAAGTAGHSPLSIGTVATSLAGIVRTTGGATAVTSLASVLPIAKVTPQQLIESAGGTASGGTLHYSVAASGNGPSLYIQTRPGNKSAGPGGATLSVVSSSAPGGNSTSGGGSGTSGVSAAASATPYVPPSSSSSFYYERLTSSPAVSSAAAASVAASISLATGGSGAIPVTLSSASSTTITTTSGGGPVFSISSTSSVISSSNSSGSVVVGTTAASNSNQQSTSTGHPTVVSSLAQYGAGGSFAIVQAAGGGHSVTTGGSGGGASGGRATLTTGPIHGLVPASLTGDSGGTGTAITRNIVSVSRDASIRFHPQLLVDASGQTQQIIVSSAAGGISSVASSVGSGASGGTIVPLLSVATGNNAVTIVGNNNTAKQQQQQQQQESPQSSILRKRALEGTLKTISTPAAGRDLTQALLAVEKERSAREQHEQQQQLQQLQLLQANSSHGQQQLELRGEILVSTSSPLMAASPVRRPSSDGSTTVSATSSPGLDEQEEEEMRAMAYRNASSRIVTDGRFKPVHAVDDPPSTIHFTAQHHQVLHHSSSTSATTTTTTAEGGFQGGIGSMASGGSNSTTISSSGNGSYEQSPRKKARKQLLQPLTDSTGGNAGTAVAAGPLLKSGSSSSASSSVTTVGVSQSGPQQHQLYVSSQDLVDGGNASEAMDTSGSGIVIISAQQQSSSKHNSAVASSMGQKMANSIKLLEPVSAGAIVTGQQQQQHQPQQDHQSGAAGPASKPIVSRKTNNVSLLQSYKQTWKAANNHFQRYTDVKQREERRPTVMDIANQSHILQKVNGWKIYHLSAQIEDLCDLESQAYGKLGQMLRTMEAATANASSNSSSNSSGSAGGSSSAGSTPKSSTSDLERINDLLKGNMQRSKIVMDGINEARTQIMKIFDHKPRVSDIILRCASKRNFKKREKT
ncbi:mucin-19 [Anopheles darlingi]|uniref:mucin-19 n=1 Tax=Anopheles darlingi TaxID=43151 RepID=UPI0021004DAA|nr:mucin-19 [Anopheles darlingi]